MKSKFRLMVLLLLTGDGSKKNLWNVYKNHLRKMDPQTLPVKLRCKLIEIQKIIEHQFEYNAEQNVKFNNNVSLAKMKNAMLKRNAGMVGQPFIGHSIFIVLGPLHYLSKDHMTQIQQNIFEIYESL